MKIYTTIARLKWPRSFRGRIFLLCFIATHIPLLAFVGFTVFGPEEIDPTPMLLFLGLATLAGTVFAFVALNGMIEPIRRSAEALQLYVNDGQLPALPTEYDDEVGQLMCHLQTAIGTIDHHVGKLSSMSVTDEMTGARNRRWMNEHGIAKYNSFARLRRPFGLILLDLDNFKTINDTFGHLVGDHILVLASDAILGAIRQTDELVRVGGDEFCIFLPDADRKDVDHVAERVRRAISEASVQQSFGVTVTASVGAASRAKGDTGFLDAYRRADQALYNAKNAGRNIAVLD